MIAAHVLLSATIVRFVLLFFLFFNDTATTEIYTLSLHDALPIWDGLPPSYLTEIRELIDAAGGRTLGLFSSMRADRKSTRLNSSHSSISYAVFCLKKKKKKNTNTNVYYL